MSLELARKSFEELIGATAGVINRGAIAGAHALFPNEFEYYLIAFEIENKGIVTDRFIFPVMPESMSYNERKITNIKKTAQGVSVLTNNSFVPASITLNGSFGRSFKMMVGSVESPNPAGRDGFDPNSTFIPGIKTGYGATKQLQRLIDKSSRSIDGSPNTLIFYNMAFNTQYVVKVRSFDPSMAMDSNMMWRYSLTLDAIAPVNLGVGGRVAKTATLMGFAAINERVRRAGRQATSVAGQFIPPVI